MERIVASPTYTSALIVGAGQGLSASLARLLTQEGLAVAIAARDPAKLAPLCAETGARAFACDAQEEAQVQRLFANVDREQGAPDVVIYNASARTRGPFVELVPADVQHALQVTAFGAFLVAQQAAARMLPKKRGAILFTGASASVKGYAQSAPFAMGKFALRGLAQSLARELSPQGIHIAHFVIDGGIRGAGRSDDPGQPGCAARSGCDRAHLSEHSAPAAQRLDQRDRVSDPGWSASDSSRRVLYRREISAWRNLQLHNAPLIGSPEFRVRRADHVRLDRATIHHLVDVCVTGGDVGDVDCNLEAFPRQARPARAFTRPRTRMMLRPG